ncbi:MAG: hypothetical protein ACLRSW_15840, partial [Christensenellaceae bacterium]
SLLRCLLVIVSDVMICILFTSLFIDLRVCALPEKLLLEKIFVSGFFRGRPERRAAVGGRGSRKY